ncbi:MAG: DUF4402 domain-containing protein [Pseudomonadota bacterium]
MSLQGIIGTLLSALLLLRAFPAAAAMEGVEMEPLFFGQIIITDNTAVRSCTIAAGGSETCDAEIAVLVPGQYGVFRLSGFDPDVTLWASVADATLTGPGSWIFDLNTFTFDPDIHDINTAQTPDASGTLTLNIGATLDTRANESYQTDPYRGTYTLQINY